MEDGVVRNFWRRAIHWCFMRSHFQFYLACSKMVLYLDRHFCFRMIYLVIKSEVMDLILYVEYTYCWFCDFCLMVKDLWPKVMKSEVMI